jgi:hypothetical protein
MEKIPYVLELEIPFVPRRLNEVLRQNFYDRHHEFSEIYRLIHLLTVGKRPNYPLNNCKITIIRKVDKRRFLDFDNLVASFKPLVDSLTARHAGIIEDDNYDITGPWTVTQEIRPKKDGPLTYLKVEGLQEATPRPYQKILKKKRGKKNDQDDRGAG